MNKLLVFTAQWCGPCKAYKPTLAKLSQEQVEVVDIEEDTEELRTKFNVGAVPTTVVLQDGQEVRRFVGPVTLADLQAALQGG